MLAFVVHALAEPAGALQHLSAVSRLPGLAMSVITQYSQHVSRLESLRNGDMPAEPTDPRTDPVRAQQCPLREPSSARARHARASPSLTFPSRNAGRRRGRKTISADPHRAHCSRRPRRGLSERRAAWRFRDAGSWRALIERLQGRLRRPPVTAHGRLEDDDALIARSASPPGAESRWRHRRPGAARARARTSLDRTWSGLCQRTSNWGGRAWGPDARTPTPSAATDTDLRNAAGRRLLAKVAERRSARMDAGAARARHRRPSRRAWRARTRGAL